MKYLNINDIRRMKPGTVLWGLGFQYDPIDLTKATTSFAIKQAPVKGVLSETKYQNPNPNAWENAKYFIPLKKDGTPALSKAVSIYARAYADTEKEACELYNEMIRKAISRLQEITKAAETEFIKVPTEKERTNANDE